MKTLKTYDKNSILVNNCIKNFFQMVSEGLNKKEMFYNADYLILFRAILVKAKRQKHKETFFVKFSQNILNSFCSDLERYPLKLTLNLA